MNIQDWFPLALTGLIPLQSKGLSRVFSNTTVQKHQFFAHSFIYTPNLTSILNIQMFKLNSEKAEEPEIKLSKSIKSSKKQESSRKTYFFFIDYPKPFDCVDHNKLWKILRWKYQITWPTSWEICVQVKEQQLELDMEQQNGSILGKAYVKAIHCHPDYLTYMQSTSWEILDWMKQKLESRLLGEITMTSDTQLTPDLWQKEKKN